MKRPAGGSGIKKNCREKNFLNARKINTLIALYYIVLYMSESRRRNKHISTVYLIYHFGKIRGIRRRNLLRKVIGMG